MKESIRYRNTPEGIEFCRYSISEESYENITSYMIQYNQGPLGVLTNVEVGMHEDLKMIEEIENKLIVKFPDENIPKQSYYLKINLTDFKEEITTTLLGQLSRSIAWNIKHTGLGFVKVKLSKKDKILSTTLRLNYNLNLHKILSWDLGHMGIKPNQIKIN